MTPAALSELCHATIEELCASVTNEIGQAPFWAVAMVSDFALTFPNSRQGRDVARQIAPHAASWLRSGRLEQIISVSTEHVYNVAVLCHLAATYAGFDEGCAAGLRRLAAGGQFGRADGPAMTGALIARNLGVLGIALPAPDLPMAWLETCIDRRLLRARTDSGDISALLMACQLAGANASTPARMRGAFAQVALVQALRDERISWLSIVALVVSTFCEAEPALLDVARARLLEVTSEARGLLDAPTNEPGLESFLLRAELGLRLRNSLACLAFIQTSGL